MKKVLFKITDRPQRLNLANYEQRLRKLRYLIASILDEIDRGIEQIETDRHQEAAHD